MSVLLSLILLVSLTLAGLGTGLLPWPFPPGSHPCVGFSDQFQQNRLDGWTWVNPANESTHIIESDPQNTQAKVLHISSPGKFPYEDLNPETYKNVPISNENAPRLVQPADGDFTIETQVDFTPEANTPQANEFQGAGLIIWQNSGNFLRLEVSAWKGKYYGVDFIYYDTSDPNGAYHDNGGQMLDLAFTTSLRIQRKGNIYTASWHSYNDPWQPISKTFTMSSDRVLAGLLLMNAPALPTVNGHLVPYNGNTPIKPANAYYHYFHYTCNDA